MYNDEIKIKQKYDYWKSLKGTLTYEPDIITDLRILNEVTVNSYYKIKICKENWCKEFLEDSEASILLYNLSHALINNDMDIAMEELQKCLEIRRSKLTLLLSYNIIENANT